LSAGDTIFAAHEKLLDRMLTASKILQIVAASPNAQ
jgi:hypothetical protein